MGRIANSEKNHRNQSCCDVTVDIELILIELTLI